MPRLVQGERRRVSWAVQTGRGPRHGRMPASSAHPAWLKPTCIQTRRRALEPRSLPLMHHGLGAACSQLAGGFLAYGVYQSASAGARCTRVIMHACRHASSCSLCAWREGWCLHAMMPLPGSCMAMAHTGARSAMPIPAAALSPGPKLRAGWLSLADSCGRGGRVPAGKQQRACAGGAGAGAGLRGWWLRAARRSALPSHPIQPASDHPPVTSDSHATSASSMMGGTAYASPLRADADVRNRARPGQAMPCWRIGGGDDGDGIHPSADQHHEGDDGEGSAQPTAQRCSSS